MASRHNQDFTRSGVRPAIKRYIKFKEKDLGRVCRKIWTFTNPRGQTYMFANFCRNYNRLIVTIAYYKGVIGWLPIEIGCDINKLPEN